jgi:hypothetical protein
MYQSNFLASYKFSSSTTHAGVGLSRTSPFNRKWHNVSKPLPLVAGGEAGRMNSRY